MPKDGETKISVDNKRRVKEFIKYFFTSFVGGAVFWLIYAFFVFFTKNSLILGIGFYGGTAIGAFITFLINRKYTFNSDGNIKLHLFLYAIFFVIVTVAIAYFVKWLKDLHMNSWLAGALGQVLVFILDFTLLKVLFKKWKMKGLYII